jgi:hypothetical protein
MTSSNTLKKLVSIGAAILLAVGGSLVAAEPAHAGTVRTTASISTGGTSYNNNVISIAVTSCSWNNGTGATLTSPNSDFTVLVAGSAVLLTSATTSGGMMALHLPSNLLPGQAISVAYVADSARVIACDGSDSVGSFGPLTYTLPQPVSVNAQITGATFEVSEVLTATDTVWATGSGSGKWYVCLGSGNAQLSAPSDCTALQASAISAAAITSTTFTVPALLYCGSNCTNFGTTSVGKYLRWISLKSDYSAMNASQAYGPIVTASAGANLYSVTFNANGGSLVSGSLNATQSSSGGMVSVPRLSKADCTQGPWSNSLAANTAIFTPVSTLTITASWVCANSVTEESKPLPVWAAPILKQIPTLSKTLNTDGGKVSLTDGDFSSLKTVTVGGKEVAFSTDAKGDVYIPIPAGKAGTTADLVVTFTGGKMVIQDGIKYVAPTDVAKVAEAGVAGFKANSSKVSGALAASILYAAQIDHKANAIACSGYAASKAQVALATARAQAACDYATGAYSNLTKSTVAVIVNKAKAKSASVGIKVYH